MTAHSEAADVIIRFHSYERLSELERAIFSLVAQTAQPLTAHVVTQRFGDDAVAATRARLAAMFDIEPRARLEIHDWRAPMPLDARSCLINEGVRHATGRYLSFLDYDDVLFPEAHNVLRERLALSGAAIAFASVQTMKVEVHKEFAVTTGLQARPFFEGWNLRDLFVNNFAPIHSYLIDRSKVSAEELRFDEALTWEEDYEFLLRLCARRKCDFGALGTIIGYYNFKTDGSNSVPITPDAVKERQAAYQRVCIEIARRKALIEIAPEVLSDLRVYAPKGLALNYPLTVADIAGWTVS